MGAAFSFQAAPTPKFLTHSVSLNHLEGRNGFLFVVLPVHLISRKHGIYKFLTDILCAQKKNGPFKKGRSHFLSHNVQD